MLSLYTDAATLAQWPTRERLRALKRIVPRANVQAVLRRTGHAERRYKPALDLVPRVAVAPHFETFGHRWVDSVLEEPPVEDVVIVGIDERSAALWDGRAWTARGPGRITVVTRRDRGVHQPETPVRLPAPRAGPDG